MKRRPIEDKAATEREKVARSITIEYLPKFVQLQAKYFGVLPTEAFKTELKEQITAVVLIALEYSFSHEIAPVGLAGLTPLAASIKLTDTSVFRLNQRLSENTISAIIKAAAKESNPTETDEEI